MDKYLQDIEYDGYFGDTGEMRGRIVEELAIESGMKILDVG